MKKILIIYANLYEFIELIAVNIVINLILNHFNLSNGLTFFIILIITIFSKAYSIYTLEEGKRKATLDDSKM